MDRQMVYKESIGYYEIHKKKLLEEGYEIVDDTSEYTVFVLKDKLKTLKYVGK